MAQILPSKAMYICRQNTGSEAQELPFVWLSGNTMPRPTLELRISKQTSRCSDGIVQSQIPYDGSIYQRQPPWQTQNPSDTAKEWKQWILIGSVTEMIQMRAKQQGWSSVVLFAFRSRRSAAAAAGSSANSFLKRLSCVSENACHLFRTKSCFWFFCSFNKEHTLFS